MHWIAFLRACGNKLTNMSLGGGVFRGRRHSEESARRISESLKGKKLPDETKSRMQQTKITNGKCHPVICVNDGLYFHSIKNAAEYYGLRSSCIRAVLRGKWKHTGGLTFAEGTDAKAD